ncbi:MAG: GAF domain-containing protein, partial [Actinomycetota bacterium]|nr:GAF domain-containing protein [Actinomycetota bacterium]
LVLSKLGVNQFDEDDVRLLEVLAGQASVALENARLYESQRREADNAKALLAFAELTAKSTAFHSIAHEAVQIAARLLDGAQTAFWLENEGAGDFSCVAHVGHVGDPSGEVVIRQRVASEHAETLLAGQSGPFVVDGKKIEEVLRLPEGSLDHPFAVASVDIGDGLRGWITVRQPNPEGFYFTEERLRLLAGLSYQASLAMQKTRLFKDQKENAEIANALLEFSHELATAEGIDEVLQKVVELAARLVGSPRTAVWLQEPETGDAVPEALWGYHGEDLETVSKMRIPAALSEPFLNRTEPFSLRSTELGEIEQKVQPDRELTYAIAPLKIEGRLGCIFAAAPAFGEYEFSERKMRLLAGIANQAKLAIANAGNFESLETTFLSTVEALANALEAKDEYTSSHARSITDLALEVGEELNMDAAGLKRLELGALFHDIGKIGIPSSILTKPGPLTEDERKIMELHPELGEKILAPIQRLEEVRPVVRHCHEHYDGSGYPDGRAGDDIPLESRIILVVDAYHAMTTDRPYRKKLAGDEARRRLVEASGTQFDPEVTEAFLRLLDRYPDLAESA